MGNPYLGEIRLFAGNFAPKGWALCDGSLLPISENEALYSLLGTTYGGDGEQTFALPNLLGRVPVHQGASSALGGTGGQEQVTLTSPTIPAHTHTMTGSAGQAAFASPTNAVPATPGDLNINPYGTDAPLTVLDASSIQATGGSQAHENRQPFLAIVFIVSLRGIYPTQS